MATNNDGLFRRLTKLFRSGPVIKRRVREFESSQKSTSAFELFRKNQSNVYNTAMSAYGTYDRMARYSDFSEMEYTPEISSALDIYAEETVAADERGNVLHVYSENPSIEKILSELFYDTINVEFNLTAWARNLCKYGDFFLFNDVSPEHGVISAYPIPVNEIEREEGFDPMDPSAVRYRWVTQGNQVLENWQVCHMRVLGNDAFLPYGSSVLEAARRIWRQLILVEDAMLVYRVVRSPERRVFYVDVGNVPPEDIGNYMEQVQSTLKKAQVVDKNTGRVDLRYNPLSVDEDYYLPVRGAESGTKIDTLAGGANATAIEDVEYIQNKLFAALKIPKAYLGYDEGLGAKATLSQEDIRFSKTINRIQRTVISELNKMAIIHLYCNGFEGEDLLDFSLQLSNPSTIAQQQKLELFRSRFEIAQSAAGVEGLVSRDWVRKTLFNMTDDDIEIIRKERIEDKIEDLAVEATKLPGPAGEGEGEEDLGAEMDIPPGDTGLETAGDDRNSLSLDLIGSNLSISDDDAPIKAQSNVDRFASILNEDIEEMDEDEDEIDESSNEETPAEREISNRKRRRANHGMTDHSRLVSHDPKNVQDSISGNITKHERYKANSERKNFSGLNNIHKMPSIKEYDDFMSSFLDNKIAHQAQMTAEIRSTIKSLGAKKSTSERIILEGDEI